ncbi:MAG: Rid family hydrolase, partial [OM182 bacterium]|nr:Rid family hydrolase [OM182 bacterium]
MSEQEVSSQDQVNKPETLETQGKTSGMSALNKAVIAALVLLGIVLLVQLNLDDEPDMPIAAAPLGASESAAESASEIAAESVALDTTSTNVAILNRGEDDMVNVGGIERRGEGRHFFTTIKVPAGAESLYLSGSGASPLEDGSWGEMEQQVVDTFESFKETLESQGWSMSDIVQVRAFAVSDEFGYLDFDGFNRGYRKFFGTEENPLKPVRTFVEIQGLVVPGWLIEIE